MVNGMYCIKLGNAWSHKNGHRNCSVTRRWNKKYPKFSNSMQKAVQSRFYLNGMFYKIPKEVNIYLGYDCK